MVQDDPRFRDPRQPPARKKPRGLDDLSDAVDLLIERTRNPVTTREDLAPSLADLTAIIGEMRAAPPWPNDIDVRRLKLGPRDLLVVSTPKALDVPTIQVLNGTVREALDDAGHPETKVLILTEGTSLGVLEPEAEPQG